MTPLLPDLPFPRLEAASDHSLLVTFGARQDPANHQCARQLFSALAASPPAGVTNLHPAYASVLVDFDPLKVEAAELAAEVRRRLDTGLDAQPPEPRTIEIPVCYGGSHGPDLQAVAEHCGISAGELIERHSQGKYLVCFLGFSPGFPYLGGMDPALATPRLSAPRKQVPAGSVAIGGAQTGIYPTSSPGGWRLIGRTPLRLFDPRREPPALLAMGDRVRFRPIREGEARAWDG